MTQKTAQWLEKARQDLKAGRILLAGTDEDVLGIIAFLCQQAVEKALKAYLNCKGIEPPRTHDLSRLVDLCIQLDSAFCAFHDDVEVLTPYAVEVRYPCDLPESPSLETVSELIHLASKVLDLVTQKID